MTDSVTTSAAGNSPVPERFRSTSAPSHPFAGQPYDQQPHTPGTGPRGFAGIAPAVPTARLRALIALLYPEEMTPMAKRQIENVIEEYESDE